MNIRRNIDYSDMYAALDAAMIAEKQQMKLYCKIGRAVCQRSEKGAAVAAAEYLHSHYPDVQGFSPRNLRRMRDFYRAYEGQSDLLSLALQLGWTQNVVILEADLPMELCGWYLVAASQFGWSKAELIEKIATNAYEVIALETDEEVGDIEKQNEAIILRKTDSIPNKNYIIWHLIQKTRCLMKSEKKNRRRWAIMPCPIFVWRCVTNDDRENRLEAMNAKYRLSKSRVDFSYY